MPSLKEIAKEALVQRREVRLLLLLSAVVAAATLSSFWFHQPVMIDSGVPVAVFGLVLASMRFTNALTCLVVPRVLKHLGFHRTMALTLLLYTLVSAAVAYHRTSWVILMMLGYPVVRAFAMVAMNERLNKLVSSDRRATVLSFESLAMRLIFLPLSLLAGNLADHWGLGAAVLIATLVLMTWSFVLLRQVEATKSTHSHLMYDAA